MSVQRRHIAIEVYVLNDYVTKLELESHSLTEIEKSFPVIQSMFVEKKFSDLSFFGTLSLAGFFYLTKEIPNYITQGEEVTRYIFYKEIPWNE